MDTNTLAALTMRRQKSTPELIADALRDAIGRGVLKGGQQLLQEEIAAQFGVSRIPLREALRQLEAEGLVTIIPNRGAVVSELSPDEAQEIYEMRVALESMAIRLAVPRLTETDLQRARAILDLSDHETDVSRWGELNWEFHAALYAPAKRDLLLGMIKTLHTNVDRYMRVQLSVLAYQTRSQQEHRQILEACNQRDVATAMQLITKHIETAGERLTAYLRSEDHGSTSE